VDCAHKSSVLQRHCGDPVMTRGRESFCSLSGPCRPASSFSGATDGISELSEGLEVLGEKEFILWLVSP